MTHNTFSNKMADWLHSDGDKTIMQLGEISGKRSFAITILFLMFLPSLPLPTGGITHIFEIIAMIIALEMVVGMRTLWIPKRWKQLKLDRRTREIILPFMNRRIKWFEHYSRPRMGSFLEKRGTTMFSGLLIFGLSLAAFLAPPFSGLDTMPALGVVAIALGMILEDLAIYCIGIAIGLFGVLIEISLAGIILKAFSTFIL